MENFEFRPDDYLNRINYSRALSLSAATLKRLHDAQVKSIPFENFDICLNQSIKLGSANLFNKLVEHKRGGYCFELNGLMLMALEHFGFSGRALLGRVHITGVATGRTHQISLITLNDEQWIVDTGFGSDTPEEPLPLVFNTEFETKTKTMRFIEHELFGTMLQVKKSGDWVNLYSFDMNHVCTGDIYTSNHFTSTNPNSIFVSSRIASLPTANGANTLFNYTLKQVVGNDQVITELTPGQPYIDALRQHFGIELQQPYDNFREC
ncbi:arylamine N-acetyltransferase family protein [Arenicella xantha]|uniref:N-hydroxyarylamine O-acetyltransferase n=1 Tax=Arenicella xantha TaxID=644221 RepID=A0A395JKN8_9GAMM|nr:arylamine N-acetyltransferase [Arenicella xantha]RBP47197.1 N-hydroxyarylamine O-acetyltransferase [Arenicella xantha]